MNKEDQPTNSSKNFNKAFTHNDSVRVSVLSEALPYIQRFANKRIVIKYGGSAMADNSLQNAVFRDLALLSSVGVQIVVVHGGGPEINQWLEKLGIKPVFLCLLYTSPSPRDGLLSRMPSSA